MQRRLGFLLVLTVPLAAGLATSRHIDVAGLHFSGLIWVLQFLVALELVLIEIAFHPNRSIRFPIIPWAMCFGFFWCSLLWSDSFGRRNVQDALQITMPLLMAVTGALFVRNETNLRTLLRTYGLAILPLIVFAFISHRAQAQGEEAAGARLLGLTAGLLGCVFLAQWPRTKILPLLGFGASFGCVFLAGGRTTTAALLLVALFHPLIRGVAFRGIVVAVFSVAGLGVFYSTTFQQRFFYSGSGDVADVMQGNMRGAGRFEAWPQIAEEAAQRPFFGHGIGSAYDFVPTVWPDMNHVHNEYLRLVFEVGFVGLAIFIAVLLYQIAHTYLSVRRSTGITQSAFAASFMGFLLFALTATTGNPLPSNVWFMNPLFLLVGAAYGVAAGDEGALSVASVQDRAN